MTDEAIQSFDKSLLEKEYMQKLQVSSSWKLELDTHDQIVSTEVAKALWNVIGEHKVLSKWGKWGLYKVLTAGVPMSVAPLILVKTIIYLNSNPAPLLNIFSQNKSWCSLLFHCEIMLLQ